MKTAVCRDGVGSHGAWSDEATASETAVDEGGKGHADLPVSIFLRGGFVREIESHEHEAGQGMLSASVEVCVRSLYPGASVSVRAADLLDGDWEVQVGELGRGRMDSAERRAVEWCLRSSVGETITRFRGLC